MIKRLLYSKIVLVILKMFFAFIYNPDYLQGNYFNVKRMGWYWAFRSIPNRLIGNNRNIPWPVNPLTVISNANNIEFDIDNINIFQTPGCYWQNHNGKITVGSGCYVAPNVGIITTNHDIYNIDSHQDGKDIIIGNNCWIGMNSVILPGVRLGNHTIVGAGAIVTHSFPEGYCVIGGNPAKVIKNIDKSLCKNDK